MKRILALNIIIIMIILITIGILGCDKNTKLSNKQYINTEKIEINEILDIIQNKDTASFRNLFAQSVIDDVDNLDSEIETIFDYIKGEWVSYNDWGGGTEYDDMEYGHIIKTIEETYDIITTEGRYEICIYKCYLDNQDSTKMGIHSIYIIDYESYSDKGFAYWGDGKHTPGINFDINY